MKKTFCLSVMIVSVFIFLSQGVLKAEDAPAATPAAAETKAPAPAPEPAAAPEAAQAPEPAPAPAAVTPAAPAEAPEVAEPAGDDTIKKDAANAEGKDAENLEFVSGEIASVDQAAKTITVKLYGETENQTTEKTLKVTVDQNTDITDGEKDRDLPSLTASTEVDVEYDPASNKATYIFVY